MPSKFPESTSQQQQELCCSAGIQWFGTPDSSGWFMHAERCGAHARRQVP